MTNAHPATVRLFSLKDLASATRQQCWETTVNAPARKDSNRLKLSLSCASSLTATATVFLALEKDLMSARNATTRLFFRTASVRAEISHTQLPLVH